MYYSIKKILSIVLNSKKPKSGNFLFYDKDSNMSCHSYWCYRVKEIDIKLSEITPDYKPRINTKFYLKLKEEIKEKGFDYTKGYISTKNLKILNGNHRYFILKELYGDEHKIKILETVDRYNFILHSLFLIFIINPMKIIYRLYKKIRWFILYSMYLFLSFL
jgi:hypothetical protein